MDMEGHMLAHQLEIGYIIPPPDVPETLLAIKFTNNIPKEMIDLGLDKIINRASVKIASSDPSKPGSKPNVLDLDLICRNDVAADTTAWTGYKSGPAITRTSPHDPEFLRTLYNEAMLQKDEVEEE